MEPCGVRKMNVNCAKGLKGFISKNSFTRALIKQAAGRG